MRYPRRVRLLSLVALSALTACFGGPRYHGPVTDHFDGTHFFTPDAPPPMGALDLVRWQTSRRHGKWAAWTDARPGPPPPVRVDGGALRVTFVNHATTLFQLDGVNVLTDPVWSERASPVQWAGPKRVRPPGLRIEDLPRLDAILISHDHYDHLDVEALRRLASAHHPVIYCGLGVKAVLDAASVPGAVELDWWDARTLAPGVTVTSAPTRHFSRRGATDGDTRLWTGFVVRGPSGAVYFSGDTAYGPHFAETARRLGPLRLAILPIGAYQPRWFMSPVHMSPDEAVRAAGDLGATTSVAMHFGTFDLADDGQLDAVADLRAALAAKGDAAPRFWTLGFGEGRDVP